MIDVILRYLPALYVIEKYGENESILEVGIGGSGLAQFINRRIVGCDIYRYKQISYEPIIGTALSLLFKTSSFDICVSIDVLEHLAKNDREHAINELIRVSRRKIIIGAPSGKTSERYDKKLAKLYGFIHRDHKWIDEHIINGLPSQFDIEHILKKYNLSYRILKNTNIILWFLIMIMQSTPLYWHIFYLMGLNRMTQMLKNILPILNLGKTYRNIFIIEK